MEMNLRSSFARGDTTSVQSTDSRDKTAKNRLILLLLLFFFFFFFFAQIIVAYIIIIISLVQISLRDPDKDCG